MSPAATATFADAGVTTRSRKRGYSATEPPSPSGPSPKRRRPIPSDPLPLRRSPRHLSATSHSVSSPARNQAHTPEIIDLTDRSKRRLSVDHYRRPLTRARVAAADDDDDDDTAVNPPSDASTDYDDSPLTPPEGDIKAVRIWQEETSLVSVLREIDGTHERLHDALKVIAAWDASHADSDEPSAEPLVHSENTPEDAEGDDEDGQYSVSSDDEDDNVDVAALQAAIEAPDEEEEEHLSDGPPPSLSPDNSPSPPSVEVPVELPRFRYSCSDGKLVGYRPSSPLCDNPAPAGCRAPLYALMMGKLKKDENELPRCALVRHAQNAVARAQALLVQREREEEERLRHEQLRLQDEENRRREEDQRRLVQEEYGPFYRSLEEDHDMEEVQTDLYLASQSDIAWRRSSYDVPLDAELDPALPCTSFSMLDPSLLSASDFDHSMDMSMFFGSNAINNWNNRTTFSSSLGFEDPIALAEPSSSTFGFTTLPLSSESSLSSMINYPTTSLTETSQDVIEVQGA